MLDRKYSQLIKIKINKYYQQHPCSQCFKETSLSKELALILGARWEIPVPFGLGRCDVLSQDILVECKKGSEKHALGQLLVYKFALDFGGRLAIGLIGNKGKAPDGVTLFCQKNNIHIFYYNLNTRKWKLIL